MQPATCSLRSAIWPNYINLRQFCPFLFERLSRQYLQMAQEFFRRRDELANRLALARQLAQTLHQQMDLPVRPLNDLEAEDFILEVLRVE